MPIEKEYSVKVTTKQAQINIDELNESFELQTQFLEDTEKELRKYEKQLSKTSKADLAGRKKYKDLIIQTRETLKDERFGLKLLNKERARGNKILEEAKKEQADYTGIIGKLDEQTGGLISGFGGLKKGLMGATKGFKTMKLAIISTGLGALVVIMASLYAAFTSSEAGQKKWAAVMEVVGAVVSVFTDRLALLGRFLIDVFLNPIETLKNFGKSIKEFVMDKVDAVVESIGFLGNAISKLFKGDVSGALEDAGKGIVGLNEALNPAVILTKALVKATKDLVTEITAEAKVALQIAADKKKAHKIENELILDRAISNKKRQELLDKAIKKDEFSALQRIKFLEEAGAVEEAITQKEIALAELKLKTQIALNSQGDSAKKDIKAELQLRAELLNLETARLTKAKSVSSQLVTVRREEAARIKQINDEELEAIENLRLFKESLIIKDKENKFAGIEAEREQRKIDLENLKLDKETEQQMLLDIEASFKEKKKIIEDEAKVIEDEKLAAFLVKETEQKEIDLEEAKAAAKAKAVALGASKDDLFNIEQNYNNRIAEAEDAANDAKLEMAKKTLGGITAALGENSKVGKAAAAASALINTYQGITAELATKTATPFGFAMKLVNIATTAAIGFKSVKSIMATNPSSGGGNATNPAAGASVPTVEPTPPAPPEFNTVGSSGVNQLGDAIGGQTQAPIQAFVVSGDVTTSQELTRNTISDASIG